MSDTQLLQQAEALINEGKNDQAIDILRSKDAPNDRERCYFLALSYFQRGDTRGDVFSSHFFAKRAIELGDTSEHMKAVAATGAFRKGQYQDASAIFETFVTADSLPSQQFLLGLALFYQGKESDAGTWFDSAKTLDPDNPVISQGKAYAEATRYTDHDATHTPTFGDMFGTTIDRLKATDAGDIDSPFKHNPVSKLRGLGTAAKDYHFVGKSIPCQEECPAGTNIPEYLTAIYNGEYAKAYQINLEDNVFPGVLGRVCARPCESECRHGWEGLGEPVSICWSKRSSADLRDQEPVVLDKIAEPTGKRVAVIGGGPAGLAAARQLSRLGHDVEVFEKHNKPGGMMNQGIPVFRLPREIIDKEISQIEALGVTITCNTEVGKDVQLSGLLSDFDAVIMAAGTLRPNLLNLPGSELKGIHHGLEFLLDVNETSTFDIGKDVVVIGGGFTAMDCARTAWRLDTDTVQVFYRRSQNEMQITPGELEELAHEGIPMEFMVSPVEYIGDAAGNVKELKFIRNELGEPDSSGRRRPVAIEGSEFTVPVDTVLLATGQFPDTSWIDGALKAELVGDDQWLVDYGRNETLKEKLFIAGDFSTGAASLIQAIGHAKETVIKVDTFLVGAERVQKVVQVEDAAGSGRIREMDAVPAQEMPTIPVADRNLEAEVETGFNPDLAVDETQRCYQCHYKYEIDNDKCINCEWCVNAKPRPNCILKVKSLKYGKDGQVIAWEEARSSEEKTFIFINQEDCIRCNACVDACPVDCISVQKVSTKTMCHDLNDLRFAIQAKAGTDGKYRFLGS